MNEKKLQTPFGIFSGVTSTEAYPDGTVKGIRLNERNMILTHAGELIPFYGEDSPRRKYKASVTFHENGMLRSVSLEAQQEVITPIGELPAELATFYDTGELHRVFPLDGEISGFWSEEEERALNIPLNFDFDFSSFTAMLSGLCFYKSGGLKSVTLFPGERIQLKHQSVGTIDVRHGFSLFEDGKLRSFEPAKLVTIATPIGKLAVYDGSASGVNADSGAVTLDEQGRIACIVTSASTIAVEDDGAVFSFRPEEISGDDEMSAGIIPLRIEFNHDKRTVNITGPDGDAGCFSFGHKYHIYNSTVNEQRCSEGDCANCALCKH